MERSNKHKDEDITMICSYCHRLINTPVDLKNKTDGPPVLKLVRKSHGICPDCLLENYPEECQAIQEKMIDRIKKLIEGHNSRRHEHLVKS